MFIHFFVCADLFFKMLVPKACTMVWNSRYKPHCKAAASRLSHVSVPATTDSPQIACKMSLLIAPEMLGNLCYNIFCESQTLGCSQAERTKWLIFLTISKGFRDRWVTLLLLNFILKTRNLYCSYVSERIE